MLHNGNINAAFPMLSRGKEGVGRWVTSVLSRKLLPQNVPILGGSRSPSAMAPRGAQHPFFPSGDASGVRGLPWRSEIAIHQRAGCFRSRTSVTGYQRLLDQPGAPSRVAAAMSAQRARGEFAL